LFFAGLGPLSPPPLQQDRVSRELMNSLLGKFRNPDTDVPEAGPWSGIF